MQEAYYYILAFKLSLSYTICTIFTLQYITSLSSRRRGGSQSAYPKSLAMLPSAALALSASPFSFLSFTQRAWRCCRALPWLCPPGHPPSSPLPTERGDAAEHSSSHLPKQLGDAAERCVGPVCQPKLLHVLYPNDSVLIAIELLLCIISYIITSKSIFLFM